MEDQIVEAMVYNHEKHLDKLTNSVEVLAENVGSTNKKLDNVIDVLSTQNVIVERMNNMDENVKEFATHMRGRVKTVEDKQATFVSTNMVRWGAGIALVVIMAIMGYLNEEINTVHDEVGAVKDEFHDVDSNVKAHEIVRDNVYRRLNNLEKEVEGW